ncbi:MAG: hypothetical protein IK115_00815 [Lachnospiraceae bacterium]|nr:hypothetical protein [Lachnospiraceae bacterium]
MYINPSYILLMALLLFLADACIVIYTLIYRRPVIAPKSSAAIAAGWISAAALFSAVVCIICMKQQILAMEKAPLAVFLIAVFISLFLLWMVNLLKRADRSAKQLLEMLVGIAETNAPNLNGNAIYVRRLSELIYHYLPIDMKLKVNPEELIYASVLIDVGQLALPRELREKWGKLTEEERMLVRKSPEYTVRILKDSGSFQRIAGWIRLSRERMDGMGSMRVPGDKIPLISRVLAVASTFAAITLNRTYKAARSLNEAMEELKLAAGTQLDKEIVEIFTEISMDEIEACYEEVKAEIGQMRDFEKQKEEDL